MADSKITALTSISTSSDPANDPLVIVDVSDTSMAATGTTKKVTLNQLLSCSPTATGAFTITGDLTVDTSTLKVDSANNRVGIGTATPGAGYSLDILGAAVGGIRVSSNNYPNLVIDSANSNGALIYIQEGGTTQARIGHLTAVTGLEFSGNNGTAATNVHYAIDSTGISTWSNVGGVAGTAMTLNSTGLGIGGSPASKLSVTGGNIRIDNNQGVEWGGANNYIYGSEATDFIAIVTNGVEALRINNSQNVGIGVTPSAQLASYKSFQFGIGGNLIGRSDNSGIELSSNSYRNSGGNYIYLNTATAASYRQYSGGHEWHNAPSGTAGTAITFTQAMTLDASGNLLVGTTGTVVSSDSRFRVSATAVPAVDAKTTAATQAVVDEWNSDTSGDNLFNRFWTESSPIAFRGSISYNRAGGLVAYNTTSDYRAKDIIGPVSNSGSLIDSLKVYVGKMKGATIERPMLIAHELQEVAPYAVSGEKDAVDADGKPKYQQMDASALVPLLIAEIKSLRARVQTLETR